MTTKLCDVCRGFKTVAPMGGINKKCERCVGIGYIALDTVNNDVSSIDHDVIISEPKSVVKRKKKLVKAKRKYTKKIADNVELSMQIDA